MPKVKTHSGSKKRFKISATGKIMRPKANRSHILGKKTSKRKRNLRKSTTTKKANFAAIKGLLG